MKTKTINTKKRVSKKYSVLTINISAFILLVLVSLVAVTILSYQLAYRGHIYPGIKIAGINVGNRTPVEARTELQSAASTLEKEGIIFSYEGKIKKAGFSDLGIGYQIEQAIDQAFLIGRRANLLTSIRERIQAWNGTFNLSPQYYYDNQKVSTFLDYYNNQVAKPLVEASFRYENGQVKVTPPTPGQEIDFNKAEQTLTQKLTTFARGPLPVSIHTLNPAVTTAEASALKEQVTTILQHPLKLTFNNKSWEIKDNELAALLSFAPQENNNGLAINIGEKSLSLEKIYLPVPKTTTGKLSLNRTEADLLLARIAAQIDQEAVDARFTFEGGRVTTFRPAQDGQKLDVPATLEQIKNILLKTDLTEETNQNREIGLKVTVTKAKVDNTAVNDLGIKELLGVGTSKFVGSVSNRQDNIALATGRIQGTLVPPGETFSMYKILGEVDGSTGYKEAYIIYNGRTKLDFGGGVCQVSTTLFRAALAAGLPIVERNPHAFRVGYYEQDSAPGVDASVFFPGSDFRFKNDTSNHILIQAFFNRSASTLTFELYGTGDGRQVSMTKPVVYDQTPPPPEVHQDDPTLPLGTVKKVENAVPGATTNFSRTVTRGGEVIIKENFYTKYVPWRAIYLHGTKVG